jgi:hypothetical protein
MLYKTGIDVIGKQVHCVDNSDHNLNNAHSVLATNVDQSVFPPLLDLYGDEP